jgi:hypothetical protein
MKNISGQYQDLLEGKMSQAQFLRNARMMFPNFVTNHNSFDDSVKILKTKGMLSEGDAVKGTPDKEPTYDSLTPDDKVKYKKVEQSPEVDEQDGIYPATTITDIPKTKTYKKVKNESDGLEPIKDNDTKNEMKKVKVVKENKTSFDYKSTFEDLVMKTNTASKSDFGSIKQNWIERVENSKINPDTKKQMLNSIKAINSLLDLQKFASYGLLKYEKMAIKETQIDEAKTAPDAQAVIDLITRQPMILQKLSLVNNKEELQSVFDFLLSKINQTYSKSTSQVRTATNQTLLNREKIAPKLESLISKLMNETLSKKSAR